MILNNAILLNLHYSEYGNMYKYENISSFFLENIYI